MTKELPSTKLIPLLPASMPQHEFVARILKLYRYGVENAYDIFLRKYNRISYETDLQFISRCAAMDYKDCQIGNGIFQSVYDKS